jgi:hypothetical protein
MVRLIGSIAGVSRFLAWPHPRCGICLARLHLALKAEWRLSEAENHRFEG